MSKVLGLLLRSLFCKAGMSKVFARRATCDEMNIYGPHLTTILPAGRISIVRSGPRENRFTPCGP